MRKGIAFALCTSVVCATVWADVNLDDFDDDLMRTMGDTIKLLEPDITANNVQAATDDAQVFSKGFEYVETYFTAKGNAPDAVKFAQDSRALTSKVLQSLSSHDTDAAAAAARDLAHSCKECHDVYKPP
jgi:hypothetical protein